MTEQEQPQEPESISTESSGKGHVKLKKLQINKETINDLTDSESKQVRGGRNAAPIGGSAYCPAGGEEP